MTIGRTTSWSSSTSSSRMMIFARCERMLRIAEASKTEPFLRFTQPPSLSIWTSERPAPLSISFAKSGSTSASFEILFSVSFALSTLLLTIRTTVPGYRQHKAKAATATTHVLPAPRLKQILMSQQLPIARTSVFWIGFRLILRKAYSTKTSSCLRK